MKKHMGDFKLFIESVTDDIVALCRTIKEASSEDEKRERWDILLDVFPSVVDNELKHRAITKIVSEYSSSELEANNFINNGVRGFASIDRSVGNYVLYRSGKVVPKLALKVMSNTKSGVLYYGKVPFTKEFCEKVIRGQMSIVQYCVEYGNHRAEASQVDLDKMELTSIYYQYQNHSSLYHDVQNYKPEDISDFRNSIMSDFSGGVKYAGDYPGDMSHIEVMQDFESYEHIHSFVSGTSGELY
jgi:hypothetical protein